MIKSILIFCFCFFCFINVFAQLPPAPYGPLPTRAQLAWHEMEMYCLIHFGVDTYTDKEWGYGDEDPAIVNPSRFSAAQIVSAARAGGFKGIIVVAKHHDGLCLWPTKTTAHSISKSPWKAGRGDMVAEYRKACDALGMKLGVYCSPWDRNSDLYGSYDYVKLYREQLKELYTGYGPLFVSWHDGANGGDGYYGGAKEQRKIDRTTYYGWDTTWAITRAMQPTAVLFGDVGPDVRWVGNEEGHAGTTSWATYQPQAPDERRAPANGYVKYWEATEGHRNGKYWMPAECDVPLRAGWFYHQSQDGTEKSPYALMDLYYQSVGRGADLDLGIAPDKEGLLSDGDVASLQGFGSLLKQTFARNLASGARLTASNIRGHNTARFGTAFLTDNDRYSYWATDDAVRAPELAIDLPATVNFNVIRLRENIKLGQRIDSLVIDVKKNGQWQPLATATSIGANRLIRLPQPVTAQQLRVRIISSAACVALSDFGLFKEPDRIASPVVQRSPAGLIQITAPGSIIHYTLDGSSPTIKSPVYSEPFSFTDGGVVKAKGFSTAGFATEPTVRGFSMVKSAWKVISPQQANIGFVIDEDNASFSLTNDAVVIDMGQTQIIKAFTYLPGQAENGKGIIDKYRFETSSNGQDWQSIATGEFSNIRSNPVEQLVRFSTPVTARYFRLTALHTVEGSKANIGEIGVR